MDQSTEEQWECFKCLKMNPKWTTICITCLEPRPKITCKPSNDSPQQYFNFFVEAVFTGNGPSSEDGDDEGEEESEQESVSDESKGVPEEKAEAEGDHEKGAEGEEQVAKMEPVVEPAAGPSLSRKPRLARKAKRNTKKFNLEDDFKKYCSASDIEEEEVKEEEKK